MFAVKLYLIHMQVEAKVVLVHFKLYIGLLFGLHYGVTRKVFKVFGTTLFFKLGSDTQLNCQADL